MKIAFFGTGGFSVNILKKLLEYKNISIDLIVSQPDKKVGRKRNIEKTPIKIFGEENNIDVLQPVTLKNNKDFFKRLIGLDFIIVVAYGKIVPKEVLDAPIHGCINMHGSMLPFYRGASPIQEAIKNGDIKTGLTIMYMSKGMDEGDMLDTQCVIINKDDKTEDIFYKFEKIGANLLYNTLVGVLEGRVIGIKQKEEDATYCGKILKENGEISFIKDKGIDIYNKSRAYSTWPGVYTYYKGSRFSIEECEYENSLKLDIKLGSVLIKDSKSVFIYCKGGLIKLIKIKIEGKKTMEINSFINGNKEFINYVFT